MHTSIKAKHFFWAGTMTGDPRTILLYDRVFSPFPAVDRIATCYPPVGRLSDLGPRGQTAATISLLPPLVVHTHGVECALTLPERTGILWVSLSQRDKNMPKDLSQCVCASMYTCSKPTAGEASLLHSVPAVKLFAVPAVEW